MNEFLDCQIFVIIEEWVAIIDCCVYCTFNPLHGGNFGSPLEIWLHPLLGIKILSDGEWVHAMEQANILYAQSGVWRATSVWSRSPKKIKKSSLKFWSKLLKTLGHIYDLFRFNYFFEEKKDRKGMARDADTFSFFVIFVPVLLAFDTCCIGVPMILRSISE